MSEASITFYLCFFFLAQKWPMTTNISSIGSSHLSSFRLTPYIHFFSTTISSFFAPNFSVLHISFSFEIMLNKFSRHSSFCWMSGNLFTNDCIYSITISISGIYMFSRNDSSCLNRYIIVVGTDCHSSFFSWMYDVMDLFDAQRNMRPNLEFVILKMYKFGDPTSD